MKEEVGVASRCALKKLWNQAKGKTARGDAGKFKAHEILFAILVVLILLLVGMGHFGCIKELKYPSVDLCKMVASVHSVV